MKKPNVDAKKLQKATHISVEPPPQRRAKIIPTGRAPELRWKFSFEYFDQAELFGLGNADANWIAGFLEKLRDLSGMNTDEVTRPGRTQGVLRYHRIDWNHKNTPVGRQYFNWVPKLILENEDEFPFVQFAVSKALGRVVGFWEADSVFQVLVVDRNHNLQPSKKHNWQTRNTFMTESELDKLKSRIDVIKNRKCSDPKCRIKADLHNIETCVIGTDIFVVCLDEDFARRLHEVISPNLSIRDILESGILTTF